MSQNFDEHADKVEEVNDVDEIEEIEFDDNIDIDALQSQLQQHMASDDIIYNPEREVKEKTPDIVQYSAENSLVPQESDTEISLPDAVTEGENTLELDNFVQSMEGGVIQNSEDNQQNDTNKINKANKTNKKDEKLKLQLGEKKYIIYIDKDNVDFIDALTIKERKKVINRLLHEEDVTVKKRRKFEERAKFINQVIIMVITVVISLPIFFVILNKANRNTHVQVFYPMFSLLLCKNPGVKVLGHSVGVFLTL